MMPNMRKLRERSQSFTAGSLSSFRDKSWILRKPADLTSPRSPSSPVSPNLAPEAFGVYSDALKLVEQVMELGKTAGLGIENEHWMKVRTCCISEDVKRKDLCTTYIDNTCAIQDPLFQRPFLPMHSNTPGTKQTDYSGAEWIKSTRTISYKFVPH